MRDRLLKQALRERFVVTLVGDEAFEGLLNHWDANTFTFVDASAVSATERVKVDGELYIPRAQVRYMQKVAR